MKNKIYLLYWLLAFLSVGCYDDKGNNDYRFVNTIEVEPFGQDSYPWAALGDTVRYKPVLHFASGNGDELDLAYEWTFAGKTIGDELNLEWIVDTVATGQVILRVTDRVITNNSSISIGLTSQPAASSALLTTASTPYGDSLFPITACGFSSLSCSALHRIKPYNSVSLSFSSHSTN